MTVHNLDTIRYTRNPGRDGHLTCDVHDDAIDFHFAGEGPALSALFKLANSLNTVDRTISDATVTTLSGTVELDIHVGENNHATVTVSGDDPINDGHIVAGLAARFARAFSADAHRPFDFSSLTLDINESYRPCILHTRIAADSKDSSFDFQGNLADLGVIRSVCLNNLDTLIDGETGLRERIERDGETPVELVLTVTPSDTPGIFEARMSSDLDDLSDPEAMVLWSRFLDATMTARILTYPSN